MRVRLSKYLEGALHALIEGESSWPPVEGRPFRVVADDNRRVTTTDVAMVLPDGWFVTLAGRYQIELLGVNVLAMMQHVSDA